MGSNQQQFELARYTTDGALDPTFGLNGITSTDLTSDYDIVYDMAIQPNGKILVGGLATPGAHGDRVSPSPDTCRTGPSTRHSGRVAR